MLNFWALEMVDFWSLLLLVTNSAGDILVQQNDGTGTMFNKDWIDYKTGFGQSTGKFWLGLDALRVLTMTGFYLMRFDLQANEDSNWYSAEYDVFEVCIWVKTCVVFLEV